jgi:uncharacterized membrane protein YqjE
VVHVLDQTQSPSHVGAHEEPAARRNGSRPGPGVAARFGTPEGGSPPRHAQANGNGNGGHNGGPSTATLVSQAASQVSTLVRTEMALAKAELAEKGKRFGLGGGLLAGAGLLALFGFAFLLVLGVVLLDLVWPLWAAVLTIMLVCFVIAGLAAAFGRDRLMSATPAVPEETASSLREDLNVVKDAFHDGRHPDERWYRYEGPADMNYGQGYASARNRHGYDEQQQYGPEYESSEAGWGTQIRNSSDWRDEGWR